FNVPDLEAAQAWFDEHDVTFVKRADQGKMKDVIFVKDPDGYWIEVIQADRMAAMGD
ncbi:MAG TPA: lactoylglutathione lyase, partial [Halomonas sp.]|nr:lactoylglutathione lyase [Halomonas sp.]